MKKLVIVLIILCLFTSAYVAAAPNTQGQQNQGQNTDTNISPKNLTNSSNKDVTPTQNANQLNLQQQTSNQGNASNIQVQQQTQINQNEGNTSGISQNIQNQIISNREQQIRSVIQQKTQEVESSNGENNQNQKMAQVAVQTMEATASMFGKSEANISKVSNEIKNSFEITTRAEERIRSRSGFVKFFAGGDNEAAGLITQEILRNENRIRELNRLIEESDFDPQTKAILQEQIQNIEQEQFRLKMLAEQELNNKGILGWLWK